MEKRGFTEKETAIYLGVSRSFLRQDRMNGYRKNRTPGPNFSKIGRHVRYLKEDLDLWLEKYYLRRKWPTEIESEPPTEPTNS
jgi:hypothetical protein